jgi:DNA-binding beta-propeller fold protein YncE
MPNPPSPPPETQAPTASIVFPPATSISEGDLVRVRGIASDNVAVAAVRVNGVAATSSNGFANWEAVVPLVRGRNALVVEAVDTNANRNPTAAQATITRTLLVRQATRLAIDSANNRALVIDLPIGPFLPLGSIVAVDLTTGARSPFFNPTLANEQNPRLTATDIAIDAAGQRALVTDPTARAVIAFNLSTGTRSVLLTESRSGEALIPTSIAVDAAGNRLFVLDDSLRALCVFNLTTGALGFIVPLTEATPVRIFGQSIAYDAANNRVIVAAVAGEVAAVDLASRTVSLLSVGPSPPDGFGDIEVDAANQRALIVRTTFTPSTLGILAVDLATGARTVLSQQVTDNLLPVLPGIAVDTVNHRILSTEHGNGAITVSNPGFTSRTVLADTTAPISVNPLTNFAGGIALDAPRNRLIVGDTQTNTLVAIDLGDDSTMELARSLIDRPGNVITIAPIPLVVDAMRNRALILDAEASAVVAIDLGTGSRTLLVGPGTPNGDAFISPIAIAADPSRDRLFVATGASSLLYSVNSLDGSLTLVTDPARSRLGLFLGGLAVDTDNARVLVADNNSIVGVSSTDGTLSNVSFVGFPDEMNPLMFARGIAIDRPRNRAVVIDAGRLIAVNLNTGARTVVSDSDGRNPLRNPEGIVIDQDRAIAFVSDEQRVRAVDLITGERVLL